MQDILWREWGDAAFDEARDSGKPVLLSIGAVWCHWCHVMDRTTYSTKSVVDLVNARFVPIRVDNDRQPDINARYNMGGWPTTAFLTHSRDVITGATYIPPDQMIDVLLRVAEAYSQQGENLVDSARRLTVEAHSRAADARRGETRWADIESVLEAVREAYDHEHHGFGTDQKFPLSGVLELLLSRASLGNKSDLTVAVDTLYAMLDGDIFDRVEGGMFRYATRRDWTVPHYEKMLEDNATIAGVLLDAHGITGDTRFRAAAEGVFSYARAVLRGPLSGAYRGSQDADEDYYARDAAGRKHIPAPRVDSAAYTDTNAMLARALLKHWAASGDGPVLAEALEIVSSFNSLNRAADGTVCHYLEDGAPHGFGHLADQAFLMIANLECYEASGDGGYLEMGGKLASVILTEFGCEDGGLYDISAARAAECGLPRAAVPLAENSLAARGFAKLADLTADQTLRTHARRMLDAVAGQRAQYGLMAAGFAMAVYAVVGEPLTVTITCGPGDSSGSKLVRAAFAACRGCGSIKVVHDAEALEPWSVVCLGDRCLDRTADPEHLLALIDEATRSRTADRGS